MAVPSSPSVALRGEHVLIDRVLSALLLVAGRIERGAAPPPVFLEAAVDFIAAFVDDCHHAKEEELFDVLRAAAPPALIDQLREDHATARQRLATLRGAIVDRPTSVAPGLREYVAFLRRHLTREESDLLPTVDTALSAADAASVVAQWDSVERAVAGPAARAALVELADTLAAGSGFADADGVPRAAVAADVMRPDVPSVSPADSLARAADVMARLDLRELPVVADGRVVGIVTQRDMEPHRGHFEWTTVRTAMTADPVTVTPGTAAAEVAAILRARTFNAVPVVAAGGALVGMLARADLLQLFAPR